MEELPVEILEMILCRAISSLKDIENCMKTCKKWRKIIEKLFPNFDKSKLNFKK